MSRHADTGLGVLRITFLPQGSNSLGLGIEIKTTLTIEVHITQNGTTATSLRNK